MALTTMYNHAGLPALGDYYQAKQHYDRVQHIRGRGKEVKPLGSERRYDQYLIQRVMVANQSANTQHDEYVCALYGDPVVTFKPDGRVVLQTRWKSVPTRCVMHYTLREHGVVDSQSGKWYFINKRNQSFLLGRETVLKFDAEGILVGDMQQEHKHKLRRKVLSDLRKKYKFFTDYAYTMLSLDPITTRLQVAEASHGLDFGRGISFTGNPSYWLVNNPDYRSPEYNRSLLFKALDRPNSGSDAGLLYELATCIAYTVGRYDYNLSKSVCSPSMFMDYFDELLKYEFYQSIFERVEQPLGYRFVDKNAKYIKQ